MSLPVPSRIGRFYLTRELGRGALGCVYLGHDPLIGRDVAIKTFNPALSLTDRNRYEQHFINEARAAGLLSHPHIVTILDAASERSTTWIAMEYLQGHALSRLLDEGRRYTPDETAAIVWRLADALDHAHQRNVIHRDIKPANIFMVEEDQPKLVDFGIALAPNRLQDKDGEACADARLHGTPNYMSPEQAAGKAVDERSDIYSLGAVMYEMLTGRKPFHADSADKLLQQIATKAPAPPTAVDMHIPLALSHVVMKAMSRSPDKRYQDAEQMALDIKRYLLRKRRARRRMQLPLGQIETEQLEPGHGPLFWLGCTLLATAAALGVYSFLR